MDQFFVDENEEFPTGHYSCVLWREPERLAGLQGYREALEKVATFTDSPRDGRQLLRCRDCGQLYVMDYEERPDYGAGNDEISLVLIPADPDTPILDQIMADRAAFRRSLPRLEIMPTDVVGRDRAVWIKS